MHHIAAGDASFDKQAILWYNSDDMRCGYERKQACRAKGAKKIHNDKNLRNSAHKSCFYITIYTYNFTQRRYKLWDRAFLTSAKNAITL